MQPQYGFTEWCVICISFKNCKSVSFHDTDSWCWGTYELKAKYGFNAEMFRWKDALSGIRADKTTAYSKASRARCCSVWAFGVGKHIGGSESIVNIDACDNGKMTLMKAEKRHRFARTLISVKSRSATSKLPVVTAALNWLTSFETKYLRERSKRNKASITLPMQMTTWCVGRIREAKEKIVSWFLFSVLVWC